MRSSPLRRILLSAAFGAALLASSEARAQLALGGTGAGSFTKSGGQRTYWPPSPRASFIYWDIVLSGGGAFLLNHAPSTPAPGTTAAPMAAPSGPAGTVFGRVGPQLAWVHRRAAFALRPTYEISNLSLVTLGGDLHVGALPGGDSYIGIFGGPLFDLDGRLDGGRAGLMPRSGFHVGVSAFLLGFEYARRSYPREELYAENLFGITITFSYAAFEVIGVLPPLPGRVIARFHD